VKNNDKTDTFHANDQVVSAANQSKEEESAEFRDLRPCMAFDAAKEVTMVINALNSHRLDHAFGDPELNEFIRALIDEYEIVLEMFNKKEK